MYSISTDAMKKNIFKRFCEIAYEKAGISLHEGKQALVSARVAKRQRMLDIPTAEDYLEFLEKDANAEELIHFLDAISTNFTSFFREKDHFEILSDLVKKWEEMGQTRYRFWSAASSSGEEPYTILITLLDSFKEKRDKDFKLLATDISTRILKKAIEGIYEEEKIKPVSKAQKIKYFDKIKNANGTLQFKVKDEIKQYVTYKRLNLSQVPFPMRGPLDVVFCRNVMIYFDKVVRQRLVSEIERLLKPGGVLMIGHTETLTGINTNLKVIKPSVYQKL